MSLVEIISSEKLKSLTSEAVDLLKELISTPSYSKEEHKTADILAGFLAKKGLKYHRKGNNIWAFSEDFDPKKPTLLLNAHHDTVRPAEGWRRNPHEPVVENGLLYGLGSNDDGASLVTLLQVFLHLNSQNDRAFNLVWVGSAEEEISGKEGIAAVLPEIGPISVGIVGEPTGMQMAVAEKGLMVIDASVEGKAGHAARNEGVNAIYLALEDIAWLRQYRFPKKSPTLGEINLAVTQIQAGKQHNVVPDVCKYVIDVRTHDQYTNQEVYEILQEHVHARLAARSFRLNPSGIPLTHPLVARGMHIGLNYYGSPTLSDQALMTGFSTLKMGPGLSERSHTPDEFVRLEEIKEGIRIYLELLQGATLL